MTARNNMQIAAKSQNHFAIKQGPTISKRRWDSPKKDQSPGLNMNMVCMGAKKQKQTML